jgi:hypothetical protein
VADLAGGGQNRTAGGGRATPCHPLATGPARLKDTRTLK